MSTGTEIWTCWTTRTIADEWNERKAALCLDRPLELGGEGCHRWEDESAAEYEMSSNGYLVYTGDAKARRRIPRDGAYCIVTVEFEASHTNTPEGDDWNWECYATDVQLATGLEVLTALQAGWYRHMKDAEVRQMAR